MPSPGFDAEEVIIAPFGHVYIAPVGTALPANINATLNAAWLDLGYLNEDGIQPKFGLTTTDIRSWQADTPIRRIIDARTGEVAISLMQWDHNTVPLAYGGGTWVDDGAGLFHYTFPTPTDVIAEKALLFDVTDGPIHLMFCFYRATISGDVASQFKRGQPALLPITFGLLADDTTHTIGKIVGVNPDFIEGS